MTLTKDLPTHYILWHRRRLAGAVERFRKNHSGDAEWILGLIFARHWLAREVHPHYRSAVAKGLARAGYSSGIVPLLLRKDGDDDATFIGQCLQHQFDDSTGNTHIPSSPLDHDQEKKIQEVLQRWQELRLFTSTRQQAVRQLRIEEKAIMLDLGGPQDRERVKLIDSLEGSASESQSFYKMAFIPRLSCSQSCRHCMLIWRPPLETTSDCGTLLETINSRTTNLLFTGGDLTKDLDLCYHAIATMNRVEVFAIFLNGHLAQSQSAAQDLFTHLRSALDRRLASFTQAKVMLQISFDEYHQEIVANRRGELTERIPVANIARLITAGAGLSDCQIVLIHKQNSLNFSTQLFQTGVFGRLAAELEQMGWKINGIDWLTSPRPKEHPARPEDHRGVIREAKIDISGPVQTTIFLISSCIDPLGHAAVLDRSEYVHESLLLKDWLQGHTPPMDPFDTDPMLWRDGTITLFDAVYLWMGNFLEEGDRVFARLHKDPLRSALKGLDRRLLIAHQEWDSRRHQHLLQTATSPNGLLCAITRESGARLFLTRWLLDNASEQLSNS